MNIRKSDDTRTLTLIQLSLTNVLMSFDMKEEDEPRNEYCSMSYTTLLSHLHRPSPTSPPPLPTLQGLIVHHLVHLTPSPTPLAAAIVSSPLFRPFSLAKLDALSTSFRHAVHAKLNLLKQESTSLFSLSLNARLENWSTSLLKGFEGGHAITRLACCSGLLLGLEDILPKLPVKRQHVKSSVEDELILAFADVIDLFISSDSWGKQFQPIAEGGGAPLTTPCVDIHAKDAHRGCPHTPSNYLVPSPTRRSTRKVGSPPVASACCSVNAYSRANLR